MSREIETLALSAEIKDLALGAPLPFPSRIAGRLTLAAAESLTVGHVQTLLGLAPGASRYFLGGITAYSLEQKQKHLGVPLAESQPCAGVSEAIARQLARGALRLFDADVAVATTGFAEPAPDYGEAHPMAWWAVAWKGTLPSPATHHPPLDNDTCAGRVEWPGRSRAEAQEAAAFAAAAALRDLLRSLRAA